MTDHRPPSPPDQVIPGLYISDLETAKEYKFVNPPGGFPKITHILSVHNGPCNTEYDLNFLECRQINHKTINIYDRENANLIQYFPEICAFIHEALKHKDNKVLVHCKAGISRSASAIIAYLSFAHEISAQAALTHLKERRAIVGPNRGFRAQLRLWHRAEYQLLNEQNSEKKEYSELKRRWNLASRGVERPDLLALRSHLSRIPRDKPLRISE